MGLASRLTFEAWHTTHPTTTLTTTDTTTGMGTTTATSPSRTRSLGRLFWP